MVASADERAARDFVVAELGPLAADDMDTRRRAATLKAFLEERSSPRRTAQRLGVHENTIRNRIRTAEELRGHTADERVAETLVALRLARVVGP
jgi:DNA-binding PucR family transcriptional regulator